MASSATQTVLAEIAETFASVIDTADRGIGERKNYGPGIGPHKEQDQLAALVDAADFDGSSITRLQTEAPYPGGNEQCDLVVSTSDARIPVEAKLLRFRRANGNDEPEGYAKVFSPFKPSGSLVTDAEKLRSSGFGSAGGLLGIHYSAGTDDTPADATGLAEKLARDVAFRYGVEPEVVAVESFDGLRHEVHDAGAIITWALPDSDGRQTGQQGLGSL
jgi:hypothetical protein